MPRPMPLREKCLAAAVAACWAVNLVLVKQGVTEIPPILMSAMRFALVAVMIVPFTRITRVQLPWLLLISFTFGTLHFGLLFIALGMAEVGTSAVLVQLGAPIATMLACLVFKEPLGLVRALGLALTVVGVIILAQGPTLPDALPLALLVASAAAWAVTNLIVKAMPPVGAMTLTGWSSLMCVPQLVFASSILESHQYAPVLTAGWHGWVAVIYSAVVSSVIAYGTWYWLLRRNPVSAVVPFSMLNPVVTIGLGILVFGDVVATLKIAGTGLVLAGVLLVLKRHKISVPLTDSVR